MRKLFSVLLTLSSITLWNPLVASNHNDDNAAAPGVGRAGSTNAVLALSSDPFLSETHVRSFNLDSLIFSRELGLFRPLQLRYMQARTNLAQQTGNPELFRQDHAADYSHFTLPELENLVDCKILRGTLNPNHTASQAYFGLKEQLKATSIQNVDYYIKSLRLCPILRDATHLENLCLSHHRLLTAVPAVNALTNLKTLNLSNNQLTALPGLKALSNLRKLDLANNRLTTLLGLDTFTNLLELKLYGNHFAELPGLDALTYLQELDLSNNQLTALPGLDALTNLQDLQLSNNQLTTLSGLNAMINLLELKLSKNRFATLPGLDALTNLKTLNLSSNQLTALPGLNALINLQWLNLDDNQLTTLPGLNALINLPKLSLRSNQLTSLPGLNVLTNLQQLGLHETQANQLDILRSLVALIDRQKERNPRVVIEIYDNYRTIPEETLRERLARLSGDRQTPVER